MYQSTRGEVKGVGFEEVLVSGFCSDDGLFVPSSVPQIPKDTIRTWSHLPYVDLVKKIVPYFILEDEIPEKSLSDLLDSAYSRFATKGIIEFAELPNHLTIAELFHGPTWAFKDISLVFIGRLLEFCMSRKKQHTTLVVGTSGDTGAAAIEAVRGLPSIDIVVLLPDGLCTEVQELMMTTAIDKNVHTFKVEGNSDELDDPIRRCFADPEFVARHRLASINSINWARILIQIVNFFYIYFKACPDCDDEVEIVVPTGGCGNIVAGCYAQRMGLPLKLVCAVNKNEYMTRVIDKGVYSVEGEMHPSLASAMDIQVGYNMERLFWLFSDGDATLVKKLMHQFQQTLRVEIPAEVHRKMTQLISAHRVDDPEILKTIHRCWTENQYIVCPHTATAVNYHYSHSNASGSPKRRICIATASPGKFTETILAAGLTPPDDPRVTALKRKQTKYSIMKKADDWYEMLRQCVVKISENRKG